MTDPWSPLEFREYRNKVGELVSAAVLERKPAHEWTTGSEGRLYVEVSIEALEMILERAGFERTPTHPAA